MALDLFGELIKIPHLCDILLRDSKLELLLTFGSRESFFFFKAFLFLLYKFLEIVCVYQIQILLKFLFLYNILSAYHRKK